MATGISPEYKRDLKRLFSKNESIALKIHKGNEEERQSALTEVADKTGLSLIVLQLNEKEVRRMAFDI